MKLSVVGWFYILFGSLTVAFAAEPPHPTKNPSSPLMLSGPWVPSDPKTIDFDKLPRVKSEHVIVRDVRAEPVPRTTLDMKRGGMSQHNYLTHYAGKFWIMWSEGPGIEDKVGQRVKFVDDHPLEISEYFPCILVA